MRMATPLIAIDYTGAPVTVARHWISQAMHVPNAAPERYRCAGDRPGATAFTLFQAAVAQGALVIPPYLSVDCQFRDTYSASDFMLIAYAAREERTAVTRGWHDAALLARAAGDERADNDPAVVEDALQVMAGLVNEALLGE